MLEGFEGGDEFVVEASRRVRRKERQRLAFGVDRFGRIAVAEECPHQRIEEERIPSPFV